MRLAVGKLAGFSSAQEVREFLASEGVKATPKKSDSCAIAHYLHRETEQIVSVHRGGVTVWEETLPFNFNRTQVAQHTAAMLDFINHFDHGDYPELIA
jgi:hypothetical protein